MNTLVMGLQWGDEGKGKFVDHFSDTHKNVIRYQGGCNAGHTIIRDYKRYVTHLIPSGIISGKECFIGNGCVIDLEQLNNEIKELSYHNVDFSKLHISPKAHLTFPYHVMYDKVKESNSKHKIGTTKRGIGPTYTDKISRIGLRIGDLFDWKKSFFKIEKNLEFYNEYFDKDFLAGALLEEYYKFFDSIKQYVKLDYEEILDIKTENSHENFLFEGAQGFMLDIDHGTYPYVTSSNCTSHSYLINSGIRALKHVNYIGVFKAFVTRVGDGPFITEIHDDNEWIDKFRKFSGEFGATTGRPRRIGWLDLVQLKYAVEMNDIHELAITKFDCFNYLKNNCGIDKYKICISYKNKETGKYTFRFPFDYCEEKYEPIYQEFDLWEENVDGNELPENLKFMIEFIEDYLQQPIKYISYSPDTKDIIKL